MLSREQKAQQIETLKAKFNESSSVVFSNFKGLKLEDMEKLRKGLKSQGITLLVVKNSLLKRVADEAKKPISAEILKRPLVVAFGNNQDDLAAPKALAAFAKETEGLEIAGGIFEDEVIDGSTVMSLALLPGREELYAKVVGSLASPISRLVRALNYPGSSLTNVLKQHLDKIS